MKENTQKKCEFLRGPMSELEKNGKFIIADGNGKKNKNIKFCSKKATEKFYINMVKRECNFCKGHLILAKENFNKEINDR